MTGSRQVLGIEVDDALFDQWRRWFAPARQPFRVDLLDDEVAAGVPLRELDPTDAWRDTFFLYDGVWTWLDEDEFAALPFQVRRALMRIRRRLVRPKFPPPWPTELAAAGDSLLIEWVETGPRPSRHDEVPAATWARAARVLPRAAELAGTFPDRSGPNCFGTVRAATGNDEDGNRDHFLDWLATSTTPVSGTGHDDEPGTVLVWTEHGVVAHAAVTIGDGWTLSKPSQAWCSPRMIMTVRDTIVSWRFPGTRLSRHVLTG